MGVVIEDVESFRAHAGQHIGTSRWVEVTQELIDLFADATGDHFWIHVDREAAKNGPFGTTIAHGYFTLSLIPMLFSELLSLDGFPMALNYGSNRVRFPAPVPVGSHVRLDLTLATVEQVGEGAQVTADCVIELEGSAKPACAAQVVYRYYPRPEVA